MAKSPRNVSFLLGKSSFWWICQQAMFDCRRVTIVIIFLRISLDMTITTIFGWICWINIAWIFYIYKDVEDTCGFPRIMIYKCWSFHMELIVYPRVHMNWKIQNKWKTNPCEILKTVQKGVQVGV